MILPILALPCKIHLLAGPLLYYFIAIYSEKIMPFKNPFGVGML